MKRLRIVCEVDIDVRSDLELRALVREYSQYQYSTPDLTIVHAFADTIEADGFAAWLSEHADHELHVLSTTVEPITT